MALVPRTSSLKIYLSTIFTCAGQEDNLFFQTRVSLLSNFYYIMIYTLHITGERILSGQSKLSLTTTCLSSLNEHFSNISTDDFTTSFEVLPPNTPKLPEYHDLQFLYDIIQKTIALKVM